MARTVDAADREQAFWDERVPPVEELVQAYRRGPGPNTALMLDVLEPVRGKRVLDFACGTGLTSAWLASRGAIVTGIDISPASIARARELTSALDLEADFVVGEVGPALGDAVFDRVTGRWALHHVDSAIVPRALSDRLVSGGHGAFNETMGLNPVLSFARNHLMWLPGVTRFGSDDEHPLVSRDLELIRDAFGHLELRVEHMLFLRVLDRNVFRHRRPRARRIAGAIDDWLLERGAGAWSYHQVVCVTKPA